MRLVFSGLDEPIELVEGKCATLEVANRTLFTRLVLSLASGEGRYAQEPYSAWEDDEELKPRDAFLVVENPLQLPWDDRALMGQVLKRVEREFLEDEDMRQEIEKLQMETATLLMSFGFGMNSDLSFSQEWELRRYLKFLGFGVSYQEARSFLDNLLNFLSLTLDAGDKRVLTFVNLKTFLSKNDFSSFLEQVFFQKSRILLLESAFDESSYEHERKRTVDLHFIES